MRIRGIHQKSRKESFMTFRKCHLAA
jgi:hypothetical protein